MLRLHIGELLPWVDRGDRIRSPLDTFKTIDESFRRRVSESQRKPVLWEFGVLRQYAPRLDELKPILLDGDGSDNDPEVAYPVGYVDAPQYQEVLAELWIAFLAWVNRRVGSPIYLLADEVWTDAGWVELGPAMQLGPLRNVEAVLTPTARAGLYSAKMTDVQVASLLATWWPSPMGTLAGVVLSDPPAMPLASRIARRGNLSAQEYDAVAMVFETTAAMDNLGFSVMGFNDEWPAVESSLAAEGWREGTVVSV